MRVRIHASHPEDTCVTSAYRSLIPLDLIAFINEAAGQIAGEAECILSVGSLPVTAASSGLPVQFDRIFGRDSGSAKRSELFGSIRVAAWMTPRPWPWFSLYYLTSPPIPAGLPRVWRSTVRALQAPSTCPPSQMGTTRYRGLGVLPVEADDRH